MLPYPPPGPPYGAPTRPPLRGADLAATITALVWAGTVLVLGGTLALFSLAFVDGCTDRCDPETLTRRLLLTLASSIVVVVVGVVVSVVCVSRRRLSWPYAVVTAVLVTAIYAVSFTLQFNP